MQVEKKKKRKKRSKANGEGTIYQKSNGDWRGQLPIGYNDNGTIKRKSFTGKTKKEVLDKIDKYKFEENGEMPADKDITLQKWFYTWLFEFRVNDLKPSSMERYEGIYRNYIKYKSIGKKTLVSLRAAEIQKYYNKLKDEDETSAYTIRTINKVLKASLNAAIKQGYIEKNYCDSVTLPKIQKKNDIVVFTKDEQKKLLDYLHNHELRMLVIMALGTGLRQGELLALKWSDIDFNNKLVSVSKSVKLVYLVNKDEEKRQSKILEQSPKTESSIRTVPIPTNILEELKLLKDDQDSKLNDELYINHDIVFSDSTGNYLDSRYLQKRYTKLLKNAQIEYKKFHALRHTYATRLFEAGIPIKTVQVLMGHSDIKTTMNIYTHVMPEEKTKAVEKINSLFEI